MPEYQMTLMNRQTIARETMAFWLNTNGTKYDSALASMLILLFSIHLLSMKATIAEPFLLQTLLKTRAGS